MNYSVVKIFCLSLVFLFLGNFNIHAQDSKCAEFFRAMEYEKAVLCLEKNQPTSAEGWRMLGEAYRLSGKASKAFRMYDRILKNYDEEVTQTDLLKAMVYSRMARQYGKSIEYAQQLLDQYGNNRLANDIIELDSLMDELSDRKTGIFSASPTSITDDQIDIGPMFMSEGELVFASSRRKAQPKRVENTSTGLGFLDVFKATIDGKNLENIIRLDESFQTDYHDGPVSFAKEGSLAAISRTLENGYNAQGQMPLGIFIGSKSEYGKWDSWEAFPHNDLTYSCTHPFLTANGKRLYFSSNMPGGSGGSDIYYSDYTAEGWSKPENMGSRINTSFDEVFPVMTQRGDMLLFASDGHFGLGGLDVMIARKSSLGIYDIIDNPGAPVNSPLDDYGLVLDPMLEYGYFTTNRQASKNREDIYYAKVEVPFEFSKIISGIVRDTAGNGIPNSDVQLVDSFLNVLMITKTDEEGRYGFELQENGRYLVEASSAGYNEGNNVIVMNPRQLNYTMNLTLPEFEGLSFFGRMMDGEARRFMEDVKVTLTNLDNNDMQSTFSTKDGSFRFALDQYSLGQLYNIRLVVEKTGYQKKTFEFSVTFTQNGPFVLNKALNLNMTK